jgi:hypothetical protein
MEPVVPVKMVHAGKAMGGATAQGSSVEGEHPPYLQFLESISAWLETSGPFWKAQ